MLFQWKSLLDLRFVFDHDAFWIFLQDIITPFALAAHSEGLSFRGGKLDDTTVVVGLVPRLDGKLGL